MNKIQQILYILHLFLPYEICLKILYEYRIFKTPSCIAIKPLINNFIKIRKKYTHNNTKCFKYFKIQILDAIFIKPKLTKIYVIRENNRIVYNYVTDIYKFTITFDILCTTFSENSIEKITKGIQQSLCYFNL